MSAAIPDSGQTAFIRATCCWPGARFIKTQGLGHNRTLRDPATVRTVVEFMTAGTAGI
jgi:hypothetical protein